MVAKRTIRPHRKSRAGCATCKRRKVKCDERKPCSNCIRFSLPCDLAPDGAPLHYAPVPVPAARRGRGRPRKTWTASVSPGSPTSAPHPSTTSSSSPSTSGSPATSAVPPAPVIDPDNAELLMHFITVVAATLAADDNKDPAMRGFWTRNAPHVSLSHSFVLHLILALAAFHLAHLAAAEHTSGASDENHDDGAVLDDMARFLRRSRDDYLCLARRQLTAGLAGFTAQLSHPAPANCGALYLGAVLTSYCTFAAGPTSPSDLLVCTVDERDPSSDASISGPAQDRLSSSNGSSMPFVYGVRLMKQSFTPDVLFAGPMEVLGPRPVPMEDTLGEPVCVREAFPRLDWESALAGLRELILTARLSPSCDDSDDSDDSGRGTDVLAVEKAIDQLIEIYAAIYGRRRRTGGAGNEEEESFGYDGPSANQFVFGWLYCMDLGFVGCVRRRDPYALLVLAYYAVLLNRDAVQRGWYVEGWREHILSRVYSFLVDAGETFSSCMRWPMDQVGLAL